MSTAPAIIKRIFSLEALVVAYFFLLLFFGKEFTKFKIAGPLYLHDLFLGIITLLAINNRRRLSIRFPSVVLLIALALFYLFYSLFFLKPQGELLMITFRQFNLFVYLLCAYVIFNLLIKQEQEVMKVVRLISWIAYASVLLQVVFILYGYALIPNFSLFSQGEYNYFSPLVIFGIISYGAYVLAYETRTWMRIIKLIFCILLSTTLGHSSAFFALFVMLLLYFFIKITPLQRMIAVGIVLLAFLPLFFLPQFSDSNAGWRLLYWQHVLGRLITDGYTLFGFGFGQPYMTYDYAVYLNEVLNSPIMLDDYYPMARYLAPPHNSIITIAFHIGLLPVLLLFLPLKGYLKQIFFRPISKITHANFFTYLLTGCIVWIGFNVILELPHSATYFWMVYFAAAYYLNKSKDSSVFE